MNLLYLIIIYILDIRYLYRKTYSIFSPPVLFTLGFIGCAIGAIIYWKEWDMQTMSLQTFFVLSLGVLLFNHSFLFLTKNNVKDISDYAVRLETPNIAIIFTWMATQIIYYFLYAKALMKTTMTTDWASAAGENADARFNDSVDIVMPGYISTMSIFIDSITYLIYIFLANEIVCGNKRKIPIWLLSISAIVSFLGPLLGGTRSQSFVKLIPFLFILYFYYSQKKGGFINFKIPAKVKIIGATTLFLVVAGWGVIGAFIGRESNKTAGYLAAVYCGAEIKNLDMFISDGYFATSKEFGHETFIGAYKYLNAKKNARTNNEERLDLPFNYYATYPLGNVYTCFYMFLYDFGYVGVPIIVLIMSFICSKLWIGLNRQDEWGVICLILYAIICYTLFFSFFSNKFFETLVRAKFFKMMVIWYIIIKVYIKKGRYSIYDNCYN